MGYELTETLWEPEEKDGSVVRDGDPRARFLVGVAGQSIPDDEAERLGLVPQRRKADAPDPDAVPGGKAVQPEQAENKSIQMGKGAGTQEKGR